LLQQIATREPRPPRQRDEAIPRELDRICLKALAKRPADRHSTALDLADDLRRWLALAREPAPHGAGPERHDEPRREAVVGLRCLEVGTTFKGRQEELARLRALLRDPAVKLVCIAGRGGIGKTALLSRLCAEIERGQLRLAETATPMGADGLVYVTYRGAERPSVEKLFQDLGRMLGGRTAEEIPGCWRDPSRSLADK